MLWIFDHDSDLHSYLLFYTYDINEESGSDIDVTGAEGYRIVLLKVIDICQKLSIININGICQ